MTIAYINKIKFKNCIIILLKITASFVPNINNNDGNTSETQTLDLRAKCQSGLMAKTDTNANIKTRFVLF